MMDFVFRVLAFGAGFGLVALTILSAVRTLVLPRAAPDQLTRLVFVVIRKVFGVGLKFARSFREMDSLMALYAPIGLLALVPGWLILVTLGYMGMMWAAGDISWYQAFKISGSSLLTLGIAQDEGLLMTILEFTEAAIGLMLVALVIGYLPTIYAAFSRRESMVTMLEVRAGSPPSAVEMLSRYQRIHGLDGLAAQFQAWESWFADIEESHTSLSALVFFRSPWPDRSWVTAAGAVLDAAALRQSLVDLPLEPQASLCIRAGFIALRRISNFFNFPYNPDPHFPQDPITVSRADFDKACAQLEAANVPLKTDREQAWLDFAGWRVNYDRVLIGLANLTMAPPSPWTGERSKVLMTPFLRPRRPEYAGGQKQPGAESTKRLKTPPPPR